MKKVTLVNTEAKEPFEKEFDLQHAQDLLTLEASLGKDHWQLPKNSPYTFTDGKLIPTASNQADKGTSKSAGANKGDSEKTQA